MKKQGRLKEEEEVDIAPGLVLQNEVLKSFQLR